MAPAEPCEVIVPPGAREVARDIVVVPGATVRFGARGQGLAPPPGRSGIPLTEGQLRSLAGSRIEIRDHIGRLFWEWGWVFDGLEARTFLPPGEYTLRLEVPGSDSQVRKVTVPEGAEARVMFEVP